MREIRAGVATEQCESCDHQQSKKEIICDHQFETPHGVVLLWCEPDHDTLPFNHKMIGFNSLVHYILEGAVAHATYSKDRESRLIIDGKPSRIVLVRRPRLAAVVMIPRLYAGWSITVGNDLLSRLSSQFAMSTHDMMCHIKHVAAYRERRVVGRFIKDVAVPKAKIANDTVSGYKNDAEVEFIVVLE